MSLWFIWILSEFKKICSTTQTGASNGTKGTKVPQVYGYRCPFLGVVELGELAAVLDFWSVASIEMIEIITTQSLKVSSLNSYVSRRIIVQEFLNYRN